MILPWLASFFTVFTLRQTFQSTPNQIYYAAKIDGASDWKYLWQVLVPMSKSTITAVTVLQVIGSWNAFMWPLIVNTDPAKMTLAPALSTLKGQYATNYPAQMAGAVMAVIPMIVLFFIFQKQFIEGVAQSGIKG